MYSDLYKGGVFISNPYPIDDVGIKKTTLPNKVILPLNERMTEKATPCVKVGDLVLTGEVIASNDDFNSVPIHATVSGQVTAIDDHLIPHKSGFKTQCITIQSDGKDEWVKDENSTKDYWKYPQSLLIEKIHYAGIVGMGGAGFPTHIKLGLSQNCSTIIVNGTECEPGIMCDDALMQNYPSQVIKGVEILLHICGAERAIIAIENDKPDAYNSLLLNNNNDRISIAHVPTKYTSGSEKLLTKTILDKEIPSGDFAIDVGIVCLNVATVKAIFDIIIEGKPLVSRIVTVTGSGVSKPYNYEARLGSSFEDIVSLSSPNKLKHDVRMGGMMMGIDVPSTDVPISKTCNCIFINNRVAKDTARECIRCGSCNQACPVGLLPQQLYWYSKSEKTDKAVEYSLFDCIECACCSYVCPSNIPLVEYFSFAKALHRNTSEEKRKANIARERFEYREFRLERNKTERAQMMEAKKKAIKEKMAKEKSQKDKITKAMERVNTNKKNKINE